jgi:hypothetical protein
VWREKPKRNFLRWNHIKEFLVMILEGMIVSEKGIIQYRIDSNHVYTKNICFYNSKCTTDFQHQQMHFLALFLMLLVVCNSGA